LRARNSPSAWLDEVLVTKGTKRECAEYVLDVDRLPATTAGVVSENILLRGWEYHPDGKRYVIDEAQVIVIPRLDENSIRACPSERLALFRTDDMQECSGFFRGPRRKGNCKFYFSDGLLSMHINKGKRVLLATIPPFIVYEGSRWLYQDKLKCGRPVMQAMLGNEADEVRRLSELSAEPFWTPGPVTTRDMIIDYQI